MDRQSVLVAMSGGVDSSVAAYLLIGEGYSVSGAMMRLFSGPSVGLPEDTQDDAGAAAAAALALGMDFSVLDFENEFRREVIEKFADGYLSGVTPNPCLLCNRSLKFGRFAEYAFSNGYDFIATGHYARRERAADGEYLLRKAADPSKDQSYVLYALDQRLLARVLFPVGTLTKDRVREICAENSLVCGVKKESQDICFIKDGDYRRFLEFLHPGCMKRGSFADASGRVMGTHTGFAAYTVGQRRGLGISSSAPLYVIGKDARTNTVTLGHADELWSKRLSAKDVNFISGRFPSAPLKVSARIRYNQKESPATVWPDGDSSVTVEFESPQRAVSPGQAVVFYDGEYVLGGGTIV